ncbi:uncharacterized protein LODBEIA_P31560 [Lodderomyces beijingensis]|uniref:Uncharacterized protein n=1 Tax=Lodderomyces beijingensis TaxID=1775926 RepID=A0ABP0ZNJ8_9ASCO
MKFILLAILASAALAVREHEINKRDYYHIDASFNTSGTTIVPEIPYTYTNGTSLSTSSSIPFNSSTTNHYTVDYQNGAALIGSGSLLSLVLLSLM